MSNSNSTGFYVYVHRREDDGKIFYVGKGRGQRLIKVHQRNDYWNKVAAKHGWTAEIVSTHESELDAFAEERFLIASLRLFLNLANITDGGEGNVGLKHSPEVRARMSAKRRGRPLSKHHIEKIKSAQNRKDVNEKRSASLRAFYANNENKISVQEWSKKTAERNRSAEMIAKNSAGVSRARRESGRLSPIICVTTGEKFDCVVDAAKPIAEKFGKTIHQVSTSIHNSIRRSGTAYGYRWQKYNTSEK